MNELVKSYINVDVFYNKLKEHKNNAYHKRFDSLPHGFVNMIGKSKKAKESSIFIAEKTKELWT